MGYLALRGIHKRFGNTAVIHGVDLALQDRESLVFVGPSGCGKSTLLCRIADGSLSGFHAAGKAARK